MCLRDGDVHIVTFGVADGLEATLAHEMVHALLRTGLPAWVEEGVAQTVDRRVARRGPLLLEPADVRRQQHHWRKHGLGTFWSGEAFHRGDRSQGLAYTLAEVLVYNLLSDHRRAFRGFLDEADAADAGQAAALAHFGARLGDVAAAFLGAGDWSPPATSNEPDVPDQ